MTRINTLNDGVQNNKMTATNQNHLHKELKRGEGNSPLTSESVVFHIFMNECFLFKKKTILVWLLMTTGSGLWWLAVRLLILQHSNSSVTT
jgi:hypothetical protein